MELRGQSEGPRRWQTLNTAHEMANITVDARQKNAEQKEN